MRQKAFFYNVLRALFWRNNDNNKKLGDTSFEYEKRCKILLSFVAELGF